MIHGMRTVAYPVGDKLAEAKAWYSAVFGKEPYFDEPFYVGFEIGGFELGLMPNGEPGTNGSLMYWGVDDVAAEVARVVGLGATIHSPIQDVGDKILVVDLLDPFGNVLGLIYNPHFKLEAVR